MGLGGVGDACGDEILAGPRAEVGGEHLDAVELAGERLQPVDATCHDDDGHAGRGQLAGQLLADPAGCTGDQRRGERVRRHQDTRIDTVSPLTSTKPPLIWKCCTLPLAW